MGFLGGGRGVCFFSCAVWSPGFSSAFFLKGCAYFVRLVGWLKLNTWHVRGKEVRWLHGLHCTEKREKQILSGWRRESWCGDGGRIIDSSRWLWRRESLTSDDVALTKKSVIRWKDWMGEIWRLNMRHLGKNPYCVVCSVCPNGWSFMAKRARSIEDR